LNTPTNQTFPRPLSMDMNAPELAGTLIQYLVTHLHQRLVTAEKLEAGDQKNREAFRRFLTTVDHLSAIQHIALELTENGYRIRIREHGALFPLFLEAINGWFMLRARQTTEVLTFDDQFNSMGDD
jgi:hypothetical protein